jgi:hypothetical protein
MLSLILIAFSAGGAQLVLQPAGDKVITSERARPLVPAISRNADGIAVAGYDVVAYFEQERAVRGSSDFEHKHAGVIWRFSSAKHRDMFAREPDRFVPQFGGYCAYAVAKGYTATAAPDAWSIVGGRLYLNYNAAVRKVWQGEQDTLIERAMRNWPQMHQ